MKRIITIAYNNLDKSIEAKNILVEKLLKSDFQVSDQIEKNTELIISIGGDGSFLQTVHKFGFVDTNSEQLADGIRFTPMEFKR